MKIISGIAFEKELTCENKLEIELIDRGIYIDKLAAIEIIEHLKKVFEL